MFLESLRRLAFIAALVLVTLTAARADEPFDDLRNAPGAAASPAAAPAVAKALARYDERQKLGPLNVLVGLGAFSGGGIAAYFGAYLGTAAALTAGGGGAVLIGGLCYAAYKHAMVRHARKELERDLERILSGR